MIKIYDYDYDYGRASVKFEVDTEKFTTDLANATLSFFSWLYDKEADPVDEVMKKYAALCITLATENNHGAYGVKEDMKRQEGFAPVDGSMGITLIYVEGLTIECDDLEVKITKKINE